VGGRTSLQALEIDILVFIHFPSAGYITEMNRRTTIYLERSSQQPLTLVVHVWGPIVKSFYTTIWGMLLSHSDRWKRADLDITMESMINDLVGRRERMPILESLAVIAHTNPQVGSTVPDLGFRHTLPN